MSFRHHRSTTTRSTSSSQYPQSLPPTLGVTPCSSHASESVADLDEPGATRNVRYSDQRLASMATDAARSIRWDALQRQQQHPSTRWVRQKRPSSSPFSASSSSSSSSSSNATAPVVLTREDPQAFTVLASTLLQCSIEELRLVFDIRTSDQFTDVMRALCGRAFVAGELVHVVQQRHHRRHRSAHRATGSSASSSTSSSSTRRSHSTSVFSTTSSSAASVATSTASSSIGATDAGVRSADLVVTGVTFDKANVFARREDWCFLEFVADNDDDDDDNTSDTVAIDRSTTTASGSNANAPQQPLQAFTKTWVSLSPTDCFVDRVDGSSSGNRRTKHGHDVVAGLRFEAVDAGRSTRVTFTGELCYTNRSSHKHSAASSSSSHRSVRMRLLAMAQWVDRVALVVRRRRLGIQVLACRSVAATTAAAATHCASCDRSFRLARKRSCVLCARAVCDKCSGLEYRETCADVLARSLITHVRVCDACNVRVHQCRYAKVDRTALRPAAVLADDDASVGRQQRQRRPTLTTGAALTRLLQATMVDASDARKQSARSVIKYLVESEDDCDSSLTATSTDAQHFAALQQRLNTHALPLDECVLANSDTRAFALAYPLDESDDNESESNDRTSPTRAVAFPIPATETQRLVLLETAQYVPPFRQLPRVDNGSSSRTSRNSSTTDNVVASLDDPTLLMEAIPELDIICTIARTELDCSGSLITLVGRTSMHVVASTFAPFAHRSFPREEGFCSQTIMSTKPLLVPHPQADVRFANMTSVANMGVQFYCGFPLLAPDNATVIGSVCCVAHEQKSLTQSQYTVMMKLAATASKVVHVQATARQKQLQS